VLGHDEEGLAIARAMPKLRAADQIASQRGRGFQEILYEAAQERAVETGDFAEALSERCIVKCSLAVQFLLNAEYAARSHDLGQSRGLIEKARAAGPAPEVLIQRAQYFHDAAGGDWRAAATDARAYVPSIKTDIRVGPSLAALQAETRAMPLLAQAFVGSGDLAGAWAAIGATPGDCYDCVRTRGLIAGAAKQWGRADYWFARAVQQAPSIPFVYADWGQALLARGQPDGAIAKFTTANQKGPHFADPLEGWGEALMAKNQSHLALEKFAQADKYAPNWGRLHLKWGEALTFAGKADEAKTELARAATLDLTPSEKAELTRVSHG
jgi:tetratricopeptide (TPR) repeat protein